MKNISLIIAFLCCLFSVSIYSNPDNSTSNIIAGTVSLSSILPEDIAPSEVVSYELMEMSGSSSIYKIETKDGRIIYQVVAMVALNSLPKVVKMVCLVTIKNKKVCEFVHLAAESIIDLVGSSVTEQIDRFFSTKIEGNQGVSSIYAKDMEEAKEGKLAYEASRQQANFPWQAAVIREYENMEESYAEGHLKIGDIITEFKVKIGDRASKLFLPEDLDKDQLTKIRSLYRIDNQETVIGALSDVTWTGSWFFDQFDEGIVFTNEQLYIRHGANTTGNIPYSYINKNCEVQYNDEYVVVYSKKDKKRWDASVADSELEPVEVAKLIRDIAEQVNKNVNIPPAKKTKITEPVEIKSAVNTTPVEPTTIKDPTPSASESPSLSQAATKYRNKQYKQAFDLLYPNRNSKKMTGELYYLLGRLYYDGNAVAANKSEAFKYINLSAEKGFADGLLLLGDMYNYGIGTSQNPNKAAEAYRKAGERGNTEAMYKAGQCYETGSGVPKKESTAKLWYKKAMDNGHAEARRRYANLK